MPLRDDNEAKQKLATRLYQEFHASKTYGKQPESLESIIPLFMSSLAKFPWEKIQKAFDTHAERNQEFPTRFDIINLIKRKGKPPLSQARYIEISRKDGEDRTGAEWAYLSDYEEETHRGWDEPDEVKERTDYAEMIRLRKEVKSLREENYRLGKSLQEKTRPEVIIPKTVRGSKYNALKALANMKSQGIEMPSLNQAVK